MLLPGVREIYFWLHHGVHELSICINSKQTVMLFVFVSVSSNFKLPKAGVNFV